MKILVTGVCGFVGSTIARHMLEYNSAIEVIGVDNLVRPGSEQNWAPLEKLGVKLFRADIRTASDVQALPVADFVIDAAANCSVVGGVDNRSTSRQLVEHNLVGTINLLEYCKAHKAGFILLSTSRVYSIAALRSLTTKPDGKRFALDAAAVSVAGLSANGVSETFSTQPPISIYGSTKLASEILAMEYGGAFEFPVFINRCGLLAGAGQFGRADQGIVAFWINSFLAKRPLRYIGFDGTGRQTRDCLHPKDLVPLLLKQVLAAPTRDVDPILNCSGGVASAFSLSSLSDWCSAEFGKHEIGSVAETRAFDIPWIVLDAQKASDKWNWRPTISTEQIFEEISRHARAHPDWLKTSGAN